MINEIGESTEADIRNLITELKSSFFRTLVQLLLDAVPIRVVPSRREAWTKSRFGVAKM